MTNIHPLMNSLTLFLPMILPHIVQPTRIRNNSKTLIDSIYSNVITLNNVAGNFTATISDHISQILIAPDIFSNPSYIYIYYGGIFYSSEVRNMSNSFSYIETTN